MSSEKSWNRPWTTQEIIDNSENWSLAGDVALLNTLKHFANNLLTKTDELNGNINNLLNNVDEVGLKLDISQNEFQSLKNTQFIESRVYDDDEALDSKGNEDKLSISSSQKEEEKPLDVSLTAELQLLDKYYETVEISISDSEDESEKSFVLKPKDVYEHRPLPPLIGSEEWYKNWYLEEDDSDVDSQKSEEIYSESDSDDNLPKDLIMSESSSELDFSPQNIEHRPVANSTMKDTKKKPESISSSDGSEGQLYPEPPKVPQSNKAFAEQLAAKLGNVISREENVPENINSKPIQPSKTNTFSAGLFSDEPPPLSYPEDTVKGIFSTHKNLFDDDGEDDDSLFWDNTNKVPPAVRKDDSTNATKEAKSVKSEVLSKTSQISKGLFDSEESEDDDIFTLKKEEKKNTFLQPPKTTVPLIDDEPPSIDSENKVEQPVKKKPVGGVSILGNQNIGDILKKKQEISNHNPENVSPKNIIAPTPKQNTPQKQFNLFDDADNLFPDAGAKSTRKQHNLFDDDDDIEEGSNKKDIKNISNVAKAEVSSQKSKQIKGLFDESEEDSEDDIFGSNKKTASTKTNQNKKYDLFSDIDDIFDKDNSIESNKNKLFSDIEGRKKVVSSAEEDLSKVQIKRENDFDTSILAKERIMPEKVEVSKIDEDNTGSKTHSNQSSIIKKEDVDDDFLVKNNKKNGKSKKISLFDDDGDEEEEDDLFSNVTKKINFKLFEEPESTEDLFSIKTEVEHQSVKTAHVEATDTFVKNKTELEDDSKGIIDAQSAETAVRQVPLVTGRVTSKDIPEVDTKNAEKITDNVGEYLDPVNNFKPKSGSSIDDDLFPKEVIVTDDNNLFKDPPEVATKDAEKVTDNVGEYLDPVSNFKPKSGSSFDDDLFPKEVIVDEDNLFKGKQPTKPAVAEKPRPTSTTTNISDVETLPSSKSISPPTLSVPSVVSLFDSTPPPDEDDWDTKSDTFSDPDDFLPYRPVENSSNRANLFDNEPPSLCAEESSDVVEDDKNARIGPIDSSSNQDIPSSERLPSDLFSDQEPKATKDEMKNLGKNTSGTEGMEREVTDKIEKLADISRSPVERNPRRIASITEMLKNQGQKDTTEQKVIPGKLKQNLNINVKALLPGQSQPKISSLRKSQSLESPSDEDISDSKDVISEPATKTFSYKYSPPKDEEKPVNFDEPDNVNILESITKERVRIPVKRRPSTRRGRKEALRKSAIDISFDSVDELENVSSQQEKTIEPTTNFSKAPSSPIPATNTSLTENVTKPAANITTPEQQDKLTNIFGSASSPKELDGFLDSKSPPKEDTMYTSPNQNNDDGLFASVDNTESKQQKYMSTDDDDDIFSSGTPFEKPVFQNKNTSDVDDLFGPINQPNVSTKSDALEKFSSNQSIFDPPKELSKTETTNKNSSSKESIKPMLQKHSSSTKPSIFDSDDDSDEDLFKSSNKTKPKEVSLVKEQISKTKKSKSLFDDNSSDDDLFAGTSSRRKDSAGTVPKIHDKKIKPSIKKLENVQTDVDPLSSLLE
ncbi:WASH complex subunit 2C isoform X1 [Diabrotica virgifera virgifera]|uniref:FAM21/CAPZIP domain-containing protein n=1 Tax=Diabrotica virgifera virgifera TaxID=50390 RepID=A0ABM5IU35_DIAVI|nr:WASH complex subunit 2C isoform X1 [Diabrotica virgifera virgifera]